MTRWIAWCRRLLLWALDRELRRLRRELARAEARFYVAYDRGDPHELTDRRQDVLEIKDQIRAIEDEEVRVRPRE